MPTLPTKIGIAMLEEIYDGLAAIQSEEDFLQEIRKLAHALEFEFGDVYLAADLPDGQRVDKGVAYYPQRWMEQAYQTQSFADQFPAGESLRDRVQPLLWDTAHYHRHGLHDLADLLSHCQMKSGIQVSVRSADARMRLYIELVRDAELPKAGALMQACGTLQLYANYALQTAETLWLPPVELTELPSLTAREIESLHWTMEGKTAWEAGTIMGVSERTARFHLNNAMRKLDCGTKHNAVIKALRLRLLK